MAAEQSVIVSTACSVSHPEPSKYRAVHGPNLEQLADVFLRACSVGAPSSELATALANAVLDSAVAARLALRVLEEREYKIARAIELAELVLADTAATLASEAG